MIDYTTPLGKNAAIYFPSQFG